MAMEYRRVHAASYFDDSLCLPFLVFREEVIFCRLRMFTEILHIKHTHIHTHTCSRCTLLTPAMLQLKSILHAPYRPYPFTSRV